MLDDTYHWAETQFGTADLGDARRTDRLVSTMAAIARAPDESLPRQLGSAAGAKAAYRLFDCGAVTREAVMDPHVVQCRAAAAQHRVVLMVQDDTTLDFSSQRRLRGAGRVGDDRGTGFLAHNCLAVLPGARSWVSPTRRPGRGRARAWRGRRGSRRCGPTPSRRSAGRRRAAASSRSPTAAPTSSSIWRASGIPAGTRWCGRRRTGAWSRAAER